MFAKNKIKSLGIALVSTFLTISIFASAALAYGPERQTYTAENPADKVTFNSITNNPTVGDERNFVRIRKVGESTYVDSVDIVPGEEYEVYIYYHNNAKQSLNSKDNNYRGIALDAKLRTVLPSTVKKGQTARVYAEISARNSSPLKVWDESIIRSPSRDVALRYIQGSGKITTKGAVNGQTVSGENLLSDGINLGYDKLNGILPGCDEYSGYVTYRFKADYADFEVSKTVSKVGENNWSENQTVNAGDEVDFKITYKNIGTVSQENVNIKDLLPSNMDLVPGTTKITTPSDQTGKILSDNITTNGINIGTYSIGGSAVVTFRAKINGSKLICGVNTLTNTAQVITANGGKSDTATVTVQKNCTPKEEQEKCKIPGKGDLDKNDPACSDNCKIPGKENLKSNDPNCFEPCKVKGYEHLKKDDPNCQIIPSELPKTGPAEAAAMIIAVTAISGAIAYWVRSREEMKKATSAITSKKISKTEIPKVEEKSTTKAEKKKK